MEALQSALHRETPCLEKWCLPIYPFTEVNHLMSNKRAKFLEH